MKISSSIDLGIKNLNNYNKFLINKIVKWVIGIMIKLLNPYIFASLLNKKWANNLLKLKDRYA